MAIMKKDPETGQYIINSRKHPGETLEKVAESDPGFLRWLYSDMTQYSKLDDAAAEALEDILQKNGEMPKKFS